MRRSFIRSLSFLSSVTWGCTIQRPSRGANIVSRMFSILNFYFKKRTMSAIRTRTRMLPLFLHKIDYNDVRVVLMSATGKWFAVLFNKRWRIYATVASAICKFLLYTFDYLLRKRRKLRISICALIIHLPEHCFLPTLPFLNLSCRVLCRNSPFKVYKLDFFK